MKIEVLKADITKIEADAIVNAANTSLLGGGGVDGAIHKAGGKAILECIAIRNKQGKCATGEAVYTTAGNLSAKFVIHTVGPVWNGDQEKCERLLANCYRNSLLLADQLNVKVIAFPNISTGIYKFPKELAAKIAIDTVQHFNTVSIVKVLFVCFDQENKDIYKRLLNE